MAAGKTANTSQHRHVWYGMVDVCDGYLAAVRVQLRIGTMSLGRHCGQAYVRHLPRHVHRPLPCRTAQRAANHANIVYEHTPQHATCSFCVSPFNFTKIAFHLFTKIISQGIHVKHTSRAERTRTCNLLASIFDFGNVCLFS